MIAGTKIKLADSALAVIVEPDGFSFEIYEATNSLRGYKKGDLFVLYTIKGQSKADQIALNDPGPWKILGLGKDLSEAQWREVVESTKERGGGYNPEVGHYQSTGWTTHYRNYEHYPEPSICIPNTAGESGKTLLRSKGLQGENVLILIKQ